MIIMCVCFSLHFFAVLTTSSTRMFLPLYEWNVSFKTMSTVCLHICLQKCVLFVLDQPFSLKANKKIKINVIYCVNTVVLHNTQLHNWFTLLRLLIIDLAQGTL